jgi:hypothetical protein
LYKARIFIIFAEKKKKKKVHQFHPKPKLNNYSIKADCRTPAHTTQEDVSMTLKITDIAYAYLKTQLELSSCKRRKSKQASTSHCQYPEQTALNQP